MNEVTEVRIANRDTMILQRCYSGLTLKQWCAEKDILEGTVLLLVKTTAQDGA